MTRYALRRTPVALDVAADQPTGRYLESWTQAHPGCRGYPTWTTTLADALTFDDILEARTAWQQALEARAGDLADLPDVEAFALPTVPGPRRPGDAHEVRVVRRGIRFLGSHYYELEHVAHPDRPRILAGRSSWEAKTYAARHGWTVVA